MINFRWIALYSKHRYHLLLHKIPPELNPIPLICHWYLKFPLGWVVVQSSQIDVLRNVMSFNQVYTYITLLIHGILNVDGTTTMFKFLVVRKTLPKTH